MRLEVFDETITDWNESESDCFKDPIQELDLLVEKWTEILVNKNEITVVFEGSEYSPISNNTVETLVYYFNVKEEYFDNGGGFSTNDAPEVDWNKCRAFYKKYAADEDDFVDALDKGDFERAKKLNKLNPEKLKPSISNSFYARWIVKTGNIEFLKWSKQVDPDIDFSPKSRFENPIKIAIGYTHEDAAIWIIDNYHEASVLDRYEPLGLLKKAKEYEMDRLVKRMLERPELMELVLGSKYEELIPKEARDLFLF